MCIYIIYRDICLFAHSSISMAHSNIVVTLFGIFRIELISSNIFVIKVVINNNDDVIIKMLTTDFVKNIVLLTERQRY